MVHLCNDGKFDCVRRKDLDEKITIAKLEVRSFSYSTRDCGSCAMFVSATLASF